MGGGELGGNQESGTCSKFLLRQDRILNKKI